MVPTSYYPTPCPGCGRCPYCGQYTPSPIPTIVWGEPAPTTFPTPYGGETAPYSGTITVWH